MTHLKKMTRTEKLTIVKKIREADLKLMKEGYNIYEDVPSIEMYLEKYDLQTMIELSSGL